VKKKSAGGIKHAKKTENFTLRKKEESEEQESAPFHEDVGSWKVNRRERKGRGSREIAIIIFVAIIIDSTDNDSDISIEIVLLQLVGKC